MDPASVASVDAVAKMVEQLLKGADDGAKVALLQKMPLVPPDCKVMIGLRALSESANAFAALAPINRQGPKGSWQREVFKQWAKMSEATVRAEAEAAFEGVGAPPGFWELPPEMRKRRLFTELCTAALAMEGEEDGEEPDEELASSADDFACSGSDVDSDDDSDDSEDSGANDADKSEADKAYDAVKTSFEEDGCALLMLEEPYTGQTPASAIDREAILGKRHLLLPLLAGNHAQRFSRTCRKLCYNWPGGGTSLGNRLIAEYLYPAAREAVEAVRDGRCHDALGELMGILLFGIAEDGWLQDNEMYLEFDEFRAFFNDVSAAWSALLSLGDVEAGLQPPGAGARSYRAPIVKMLKQWAADTNEALRSVYGEQGRKARLRIKAEAAASPETAAGPGGVHKRAAAGEAAESPPPQRVRGGASIA